jgi:hypothetical protein
MITALVLSSTGTIITGRQPIFLSYGSHVLISAEEGFPVPLICADGSGDQLVLRG